MKLNEIHKNKYYFAGTCISSFDEEGSCTFKNFVDVTDFAGAEERAKKISKEKFDQLITLPKSILTKINNHKIEYLHDHQKDVIMLYDHDADVHYFFIK